MQHLYRRPEGKPCFQDNRLRFKPRQGSSRCVELNHMLHRLCGPPSIPLSFGLATVLPRGGTYRVSSGTAGVNTRNTKCPSFTARTTRVSNPVCSPSFRASASVPVQRAAFATGVPPNIYAFHRYTGNSTLLSRTQVPQYRMQFPG